MQTKYNINFTFHHNKGEVVITKLSLALPGGPLLNKQKESVSYIRIGDAVFCPRL